jgi:hypothetical protein
VKGIFNNFLAGLASVSTPEGGADTGPGFATGQAAGILLQMFGARAPRLGGLGAAAAGAEAEAGMVATSELRATHGVSRNAVRKLAADIEKNGIREPLKYVEHEGEKYVVDGNHRLRAARQLGLKQVPAERVELPYRGYKTPGDLVYTP